MIRDEMRLPATPMSYEDRVLQRIVEAIHRRMMFLRPAVQVQEDLCAQPVRFAWH